MPLSKEMRLLKNKWLSTQGWPKRLEWVEIEGIRGWVGQRIEFNFPMIAICGENGSGKSTILQAATSVYSQKGDQTDWYASDFFPWTPWDTLDKAELRYSYREGDKGSQTGKLRKFRDRWKGYTERPKREVQHIDLDRIQPISARTGYSRIAKSGVKEVSSTHFDNELVSRMSYVMGKEYSAGKLSLTDADPERRVPVVSMSGVNYSGFHQGAGELIIAELLSRPLPKYTLVLIDEIESSLHPRAQRRLIRDLAEICRVRELQVVCTTHSPYVLDEFPPEARGYIMQTGGRRDVVFGVSPEFAMTKMDEEAHPEWDLYVEDERAKTFLNEILVAHARELMSRFQSIAFGAAGVGRSLGVMVKQNKFPRPSLVFLDGDQDSSDGCIIFPGGDMPERVVFSDLRANRWNLLEMRLARPLHEIEDAAARAMTNEDAHIWPSEMAKDLLLSTETLWQIMCSSWAGNCLLLSEAKKITDPIRMLGTK